MLVSVAQVELAYWLVHDLVVGQGLELCFGGIVQTAAVTA